MSELYFRLAEMKGFTAIDLADKKESYANPIRELLQNSLDASRYIANGDCEINIYIETISKNEIPHIECYEEVLKKAISTAEKQKSYNENSQQRVRQIKSALEQEQLKVLMFSDNGTGMAQNKMDAMLTGGVSIKENEDSGGSFGVGNLSSYSLSSLRYVLYATKYRDDNEGIKALFTGSPILAGYQDENAQRGNRGRIVKEKPENESNPIFVYPEEFPSFLNPKMADLDTGTIVAILGLSENWDIEAEYAIASNFFHGIAHDGLKIKIHNDNQETKPIDISAVESIIEEKKDSRRAMGENILSGKATYHALKAVIDGDQKEIILSNSDKVHVCVRTDKDADPAIVLIRNGMLIARHDSMLSSDMNALRKATNFEPFTAVIDVDKNAPQLHKLVKGAESPHHNKLQRKILDRADERCLQKLLKELSEKITEHLVEVNRDSFDLPLFPIPNKAEAQSSGASKSSGQNDKAKKQQPRKKPPKPKPPETNPPETNPPEPIPPRPKPVVISRNLESTNAARYTDKGDKWEVKLRIVPNMMDANDDVWLSMCLGEDNDNEETKTYLDFIAVEINGKTIEIPNFIAVEKDGKLIQENANKSQIKLGQLKQATQYNIIVQVKKPPKIGGMKVALLPILGLKRRPKKAKKVE